MAFQGQPPKNWHEDRRKTPEQSAAQRLQRDLNPKTTIVTLELTVEEMDKLAELVNSYISDMRRSGQYGGLDDAYTMDMNILTKIQEA